VARSASIALVAALLVATGAAFAYTERLKLTPSPILRTTVLNKVFSPVCDCDSDVAVVRFQLRKPDRIDVEIVEGETVTRRLVQEAAQRGRVEIVWDGRDDAGAVVPEGTYRARVRLLRGRRTITLPNPIRVDVTPPVVERFSVAPRVFSPDGDGLRDAVVVRYRISEPARVALYVDGARQVLKRGTQAEGRIRWPGLVDGEPVGRGVVALRVGATDIAGNVGARSAEGRVVVRFVALGRERIEAVAGRSFAVLVLSDARRVRWRLGERSGVVRPGTLRLRAPALPGRYALVVTANGHADRSVVLVRAVPGAVP
jgi:hypothetical protein